MSWIGRLRALWQGERLARELDDELRFHLEMRTRDNLAAGLSPAEARADARRRFGNPALIHERTREMDVLGWLESAAGDLRFGARLLGRSPGFSSVAVLTLALGIGANSALFSVIEAALFRPLPYRPGGVVVVLGEQRPCCRFGPASPLSFLEYRRRARSFETLAAFASRSFTLTRGGAEPLWLQGEVVTPDYFAVLGVPPLRGRTLDARVDRPGGPRAAVLAYGTWQKRFGADPAVLGSNLTLSGQSYTVVGIMGESFRPPAPAEVWVSARYPAPEADDDMPWDLEHRRRWHYLRPLGRLRPGVTVDQARAELATLSARLEREDPEENTHKRALLVPALDWFVGDSRPALWTTWGAVALILLIACSNLASLLLARGTARRPEMALRTALGAPRRRLVRQLLTESLLLAGMGGLLGLAVAVAGVQLLAVLRPGNLPRIGELRVDLALFVFATLASLLAGLLAGLAPALRAARTGLESASRQGGRAVEGGAQRLRRLLVGAEIAMALTLLVGAGLLIRSFSRLLAVDPGFQPERVIAATLALPASRYPADAAVADFTGRLLERVGALPGVTAAGIVDSLPFSGENSNGFIFFADRPRPRPGDEVTAEQREVSGGYFRALGIPLLRGRTLDDHDDGGARRVVVVNDNLARFAWPHRDPLGQRLRWGTDGAWMTVVGVVGNVHQFRLDERPTLDTYVPYRQVATRGFSLAVRSAGNPLDLAAQLRAEVLAVDRDQPLRSVDRLADLVGSSLARRRVQMLLIGALAVLALFLASLGAYGVMSFFVLQRTREIGIRVALGAGRGGVFRLIFRGAAGLAAAGIACGVLVSLAFAHWLQSLLYEVKSTDPTVYLAASAALLLVSLCACCLPALRATRIDPQTALRGE